MTIGYANGTGRDRDAGPGVQRRRLVRRSPTRPTGAWGVFGSTVNASVTLNAGWNMIRLAKGSPNFAGGTGYAELDAITLS